MRCSREELTMDGAVAQERVRADWDQRPCDSELSARERLSREFFLDVERQRYALQPHILECLSWIDWSGKRVLEVGAGIGTDARRLIGAGARYTGINVDRGSAVATEQALRVFSMPGVSLQRDARSLDFPDGAGCGFPDTPRVHQVWIEELCDVHDAILVGQRRHVVDLLVDDEIGLDVAGGVNGRRRAEQRTQAKRDERPISLQIAHCCSPLGKTDSTQAGR